MGWRVGDVQTGPCVVSCAHLADRLLVGRNIGGGSLRTTKISLLAPRIRITGRLRPHLSRLATLVPEQPCEKQAS